MYAAVALTVALLVLAAAVLYAALPAQTWAPLGPYDTQEVHLPISQIDGLPTLNLAETTIVPVTGTKCVRGDGFTISGESSWQSVSPPGTALRTGEGTRDAVDGCTRFAFENVVPEQVRRAMREQIRHGIDRPVWRIVGIEVPHRGSETGASADWRTERFAVVAR